MVGATSTRRQATPTQFAAPTPQRRQWAMIDFTLPPEVDEIRLRVRAFMDERVRPEWEAIDQSTRSEVVGCIVRLRREARWRCVHPVRFEKTSL